jgi:hypothetical protein
MPTEYTKELMEKGQSFSEFIITCAKAFNIFKSDPFEKIRPRDYYIKELKEIKKRLNQLRKLTEREKYSFGQFKRSERIRELRKWISRHQIGNNRLLEMKKQVDDWIALTEKDQELKKFMLKQIDFSKNDLDHTQKMFNEAKIKTPIEFYNNEVFKLESDFKFYMRKNDEEIKRIEDQDNWFNDLRMSILKKN